MLEKNSDSTIQKLLSHWIAIHNFINGSGTNSHPPKNKDSRLLFSAINLKCESDDQNSKEYIIEEFDGTIVGNQLDKHLVFMKSITDKKAEILQGIESCLKEEMGRKAKLLQYQRGGKDCYFRYPQDAIQDEEAVVQTINEKACEDSKSKKFQIDQRKFPVQEWTDKYRSLLMPICGDNCKEMVDTLKCLDMLIRKVDKNHKPKTKGKKLVSKEAFQEICPSYNQNLIDNLELQYIYSAKLHVNCKLMKHYLQKTQWVEEKAKDKEDEEAHESQRIMEIRSGFDINGPLDLNKELWTINEWMSTSEFKMKHR